MYREADEIVIIVDRSGSMWNMQEEAQNGINNFIREQKKIGKSNITLAEFDDNYNVVYDRKKSKNVETDYKLIPRGMTALYDAVGKTMTRVSKEVSSKAKSNKILMIVTDGVENASKEWNQSDVKKLLKRAEKVGWEIIYMASNINAKQTGQLMGVTLGKTMGYVNDNLGNMAAYNVATEFVSNVRGGMAKADADAQFTHTVQLDTHLTEEDEVIQAES